MKRIIPGLVILLSAAAPALAASLVIWPPDATTQDSRVEFVPNRPGLENPSVMLLTVYRALLVMP